MRVLFGLLLLAFSALAVSAQPVVVNPDSTNTFHFTAGNGATWTVGGQPNPILNMTIGTTYFISIEFPTNTAASNHPFGLSTVSSASTVGEMGLVNVNNTCGGTANPGYTATGPNCVLAFKPNATTPSSLFYHCSVHSGMVGSIQLNGAAAATNSTTASPTTATPTATPTPAGPIQGASIAADAGTNIFHVTNGNAGTGWTFTSGTQQFLNPTLNMTAGTTYFISIEFDTTIHPFALNTLAGPASTSVTANTGLGLANSTACGVASNGYQNIPGTFPKCTVSFTPTATTPQPLYYHCVYHGNMWGQIQVLGAPSSTTSPPTTPHGSASALVPGVAAVIAAVAGFAAL